MSITFVTKQVSEIFRIAAAAATAIKSDGVKNNEPDNSSSSPLQAGSPVLQNTAAAMGSLLAQLCPSQKSTLCKIQAGNNCTTKLESECTSYDA